MAPNVLNGAHLTLCISMEDEMSKKKSKKKGKANKTFKTLAEVMKTYFPNREFKFVIKSDS